MWNIREVNNNIDNENREDGLVISIDDFLRCVKYIQEKHGQIYQDRSL